MFNTIPIKGFAYKLIEIFSFARSNSFSNSFSISLLFTLLFLQLVLGPKWLRAEEVVIYTSLDQIFSEPILQGFEEKTGIKVRAVYDVEAAKTTGLVNRLIAEKNNPQADVFWNSEVSRTIILNLNSAI